MGCNSVVRAVATCTLALSFAGVAHASDGQITFSGQVTAQTCTINGGTSAVSVTLPTVSVGTLASAGATAGRTPFQIALTGCNPTTGNVSVYFEPGATVDATNHRLINGGTATNVAVQLRNVDTSVIQLGNAQGSQSSQVAALSSGAATLRYFGEYYATGTASSGTVSTSVNYTIAYQ